jgi:hypothetical protein
MLGDCENCSFAQSPNADPVCQNQYDQVFGKSEVNVHVAFGYMDDSEHPEGGHYAGVHLLANESIDNGALAGMIYQLVQPCRGDTGACGFTRHPVDQFLLSKQIQYRGRTVTVNLHMTNGSATPVFQVNTAEGRARQALATRISEENFFDTLGTSDLTVYNGHARSGGGPDFNPPIRRSLDGHPDYAGYYRIKQPGLKHLVSSLKKAPKQPPLLALIACDSDDLFRSTVQKAAPHTGLVTTSDLFYFENGFTATFLVVDSFLRQECGPTFEQSLRTLRTRNGAYLKLNNFLQQSSR